MAPFPYLPMLAISASLITHQIAMYNIFSYNVFMILHLGVVDDKDKAGYYAGILTSSFMIGRMLTSYFWGCFADRNGYRKVILVGLSSAISFSVAFGFSWTFWWALLFRFPFLLPNLSVAGLGLLALPLVSLFIPGYQRLPATNEREEDNESLEDLRLSKHDPNSTPMQQWSESPSLAQIDRRLRYRRKRSLDGSERVDTPTPGIVMGTSATLTPSSPRVPSWAPRHDTFPPSSEDAEEEGTLPHGSRAPAGSLERSHLRIFLIIYGLHSFLFAGFDDVYSLWALSTVASGGLNWTAQQIGQILLFTGGIVLFVDAVAVPYITVRIGIKVSQRLGSLLEVPVYAIVPVLARLRGTNSLCFTSVIMLCIAHACSNSIYIAIALAINNSTDVSRRGEVNGLAASIGSMAKATGSLACSALFAFSIDGDRPFPFDVHFVWYILAILGFIVALLGWNTIRDDAGHAESSENAFELDELDGIIMTGLDDASFSSEAATPRQSTIESERWQRE